ncbi:unnamed protein product [Somion occarium]|uniref:Uncharacterized protein n=1 Tax=Somion occarium TaxID=3059160 RepID=A0ABP1D5M9_9APHY
MTRYDLAVVLAHYLWHWYYTSIEMKPWSEMEHELKFFLPVNPAYCIILIGKTVSASSAKIISRQNTSGFMLYVPCRETRLIGLSNCMLTETCFLHPYHRLEVR